MTIHQEPAPTDELIWLSLGIGAALGSVAAITALVLFTALAPLLPPTTIVDVISQWVPAAWQEGLLQQAQLMGFPLQGESKAYWYMARVSGLLAYLLIWGSTVWGLALSTKIGKEWLSPALAFSVHEFLSWLGLGFGLFHGLILLGDRYINFELMHILLPFSAPYEPFWVGIGTLALYLYALVIGSFYVRKQIGQSVWRALHYLTFAAYLMITTHSLAIGSESGLVITQAVYIWSAAVILCLTLYRIWGKV